MPEIQMRFYQVVMKSVSAIAKEMSRRNALEALRIKAEHPDQVGSVDEIMSE